MSNEKNEGFCKICGGEHPTGSCQEGKAGDDSSELENNSEESPEKLTSEELEEWEKLYKGHEVQRFLNSNEDSKAGMSFSSFDYLLKRSAKNLSEKPSEFKEKIERFEELTKKREKEWRQIYSAKKDNPEL